MADGRWQTDPLMSIRSFGNASPVRDYRKIVAWQRADQLVDLAYAVAESLPSEERFGLAAQLKRASVSIAANIAEGSGRSSDADFERYLSIAAGSASELQSHLGFILRRWPDLPTTTGAIELAHEVKRMLWSLLEASRSNRPR